LGVALLALFVVTTTVAAQRHEKAREPSLFSSEFILESADAIGLSAAQKDAIAALVREHETASQEGNTELKRDSEQLLALLDAQQVDESAVGSLLDEILQRDNAAKKAEILYLIRLRNILTQEQRAKLAEIKASSARPAPAGPAP
jgi:Spy/CpxP family protein refolding chaperone